MTIICAMHDTRTGHTVIGSNVGALSGATRIPLSTTTWLTRNGRALGVAGQHRQFEILRHHADELLGEALDPFALSGRIRNLFRDYDIYGSNRPNDAQSTFGITMILALSDSVWDFDGTLAPCRIDNDTVWARGSGMHFALGAGFACATADPVIRVETAIDAARHFDVDCPGDRHVEILPKARRAIIA